MSSWIEQLFASGQASAGKVVRRSARHVAAYAGGGKLEKEVRARGFHMALIGEEYVIVCDPDAKIEIIC